MLPCNFTTPPMRASSPYDTSSLEGAWIHIQNLRWSYHNGFLDRCLALSLTTNGFFCHDKNTCWSSQSGSVSSLSSMVKFQIIRASTSRVSRFPRLHSISKPTSHSMSNIICQPLTFSQCNFEDQQRMAGKRFYHPRHI